MLRNRVNPPPPSVDGIPGRKVAGFVMGKVRAMAARMNARGRRRTIDPDAPGTMTAIRSALAAGTDPGDLLHRIQAGFRLQPKSYRPRSGGRSTTSLRR